MITKLLLTVAATITLFSIPAQSQQCDGRCEASPYAPPSQARACNYANYQQGKLRKDVCDSLSNCAWVRPQYDSICRATPYAGKAQARACNHANAFKGDLKYEVCESLPNCYIVNACY